jgi:hypothetical protein
MSPENFCYWLQGRAELVAATPSDAEWESIKQHLNLVLTKQTPPGPGNGHYISGLGLGRSAELRPGDMPSLGGNISLTC